MSALPRCALLAAAAALLCAAAAPAPRIEGPWAFKTEPYREGSCVLTGTLTLRPAAAGAYEGAMNARERCEGFADVFTEQSCTAQLTPAGLVIRSTVERVRPEQMSGSYAPDHFVLPRVSAEQMSGELQSAADAPVQFVRPIAAIS